MRRLFRTCLIVVCAALPGALFAAPPMPAQGTVEAAFTPWDDAEGAILRALSEARQTVHVQAYLLTSRNIANALLAAQARGVAVAVLTDDETLKGDNSLVPKLAEKGIPVWVETRYANAHNKVLLIDAEGEHPAVVTGSYNFTWSAQARNAENLLILRDNRTLAAAYLANWQRHRADAQAYSSVMEPAHAQ